MKDFSQSVTAVTLFFANFHFWSKSGYFDSSVDMKPLIHTWSLAVEEQYYFIFPLFLFLIWRSKLIQPLVAISAVTVVSFLYSCWAVEHHPSSAFYLLPSRIWELGVGGIIAVLTLKSLPQLENKFYENGACLLGLAMLFYGFLFFDHHTSFPGVNALFPVAGTALLILFCRPEEGLGRLFARPGMVHIGLISYGLYLWHQPLFAFARHNSVGELSPWTYLGLTFLSAVLAHISWKYVETPFRNRKKLLTPKVLKFAGATATLFIVFGISGHHTDGFNARLQNFTQHLPSHYMNAAKADYNLTKGLNGESCVSEAANLCHLHQASEARPSVLLIGDSHSADFSVQYKNWVQELNLNAWQMSIGGCAFLKSQDERDLPACRNALKRVDELLQDHKMDHIILVGNYEQHTRLLSKPERARDIEALQTWLRRLGDQGAQIYFFTTRPTLNTHPVRAALINKKDQIKSLELKNGVEDWKDFYKAIGKSKNVRVYNQAHELLKSGCGKIQCFDGHTEGQMPLYRDSNHLTALGAKLVFRRFLESYRLAALH